jgi:hypothetical protein
MRPQGDDSEANRTCRRRADSLHKQYLLAACPARGRVGAVLGRSRSCHTGRWQHRQTIEAARADVMAAVPTALLID